VKKILIIDDEELNRKLVRESIEGPEFVVIEAEDGSDGIYLAKKEMPDLILLDLAMPDVDGIETCKRLKEVEKTRDIPIIMLSAINEKKLIDIALKQGAADYFVKPIKQAELLSTINKWAGK